LDLDRQTIEKKDFPIGRRGYDPEAVDAHLARVASEVDALRRASTDRPASAGESLASVAASQVQAIVEAAETTAADIRRQAEQDARRASDDAEAAAERTRGEAVERAQTHVEAVAKASSLMLQRVGAMESEINALTESLRTGANRLTADLALLEGNMGELYEASGRKPGDTGAASDTPSFPPVPASDYVASGSDHVASGLDAAEPEVEELAELPPVSEEEQAHDEALDEHPAVPASEAEVTIAPVLDFGVSEPATTIHEPVGQLDLSEPVVDPEIEIEVTEVARRPTAISRTTSTSLTVTPCSMRSTPRSRGSSPLLPVLSFANTGFCRHRRRRTYVRRSNIQSYACEQPDRRLRSAGAQPPRRLGHAST
jgi:DivIVA domain-containing protein